jgi:8-oxo-dGTP diphosphatase
MGVAVHVLEQAMHTHHEYPSYDIDFRVFHCRLAEPESRIRHLRVHDHRWVTLEEMAGYRFPDADAKTLAKLLDLDS